MRTTVDLDEELLEEVEELTGEKSLSKAVNKAMSEYVRAARLKNLLALKGKVDLNLDDWYEFRHAERS